MANSENRRQNGTGRDTRGRKGIGAGKSKASAGRGTAGRGTSGRSSSERSNAGRSTTGRSSSERSNAGRGTTGRSSSERSNAGRSTSGRSTAERKTTVSNRSRRKNEETMDRKINGLRNGTITGSGQNGKMTLADYGEKFGDSVTGEVREKYKRWGKNRRDQHGDIKKTVEERAAKTKSRGKSRAGYAAKGTEVATENWLSNDEWQRSEDVEGNDRIEGRNAVLEALKGDIPFNKIVMAEGANEGAIKQIYAKAKDKGIVIQEVSRNKLDAITGNTFHQGVIAYIAAAPYVEVSDILQKASDKGEDPFVLVLDEIIDPQNLGAIIRTAEAAGVHGVIIPKRRAVGLTSVVAKAAAGATAYMPVARVINIARTIEELKNSGLWIIGTDSEGEKSLHNSDLKGAVAIVTGSEGEGMSRLVRDNCDFIVSIPMKGKIGSLNASAATALMLYEVVRQRG